MRTSTAQDPRLSTVAHTFLQHHGELSIHELGEISWSRCRSPYGLGFVCPCGHPALWWVDPGYFFCPPCGSLFTTCKVGTHNIGLYRML